MKICPHCQEKNFNSAISCECGYSFAPEGSPTAPVLSALPRTASIVEGVKERTPAATTPLPSVSTEDKSDSGNTWGCLLMILIMVYGLAQIYAGFIGIKHHWGAGWAVGAVVVSFIFRFSLPLTIGSFFGAMNVWGWHWLGALVFAAPGLLFLALMIPEAVAAVLTKIRR